MVRGHRMVVSLETKDFKVAIHKAIELQKRPHLVESQTLESEIEKFIEHKLKREEFSRFSAENKKLTLLRFKKQFGDIAPIAITSTIARNWWDGERKRVSTSTAQGYLMTMRSFCSWLISENVIVKNPFEGIEPGKWDYGQRVKFCDLKTRDALIENWGNDQELGFILHVGFEAGLRRNEIVEARPEWFDMKAKAVFVRETDSFRPKDRETRAIPMTDVLIDFIEQYEFTGKYCIMPNQERGKARYRYDFIKKFSSYMKAQKVPWVTPHVMRHTFGSLLAIQGESLLKIARWMGDDPRVVEKHYAHLQPSDKSINRLRS